MRILVCGGRDYENHRLVYRTLDALTYNPEDEYHMPHSNTVIIHGGARGADQHADDWAVVNWIAPKVFEADWEQWGKSAGYRRNFEMLHEGKPNLVVAFPGGKGTANMVGLAKKANVPVLEIEDRYVP